MRLAAWPVLCHRVRRLRKVCNNSHPGPQKWQQAPRASAEGAGGGGAPARAAGRGRSPPGPPAARCAHHPCPPALACRLGAPPLLRGRPHLPERCSLQPKKKSQRSLQRLKWHALLLSMHMQGLKPRTALQRRRGSPPGRGRALVRAQVRCPLCQDDSDRALCVLHHMPRPRCSAVWCGDAAPQGKDAPRKGRQAPPHDAQRPATVRQAQRHPQTLHKLSRAGACWPSHWSSAFLWEGTEALHDHIQSLRWRRAPRCNHCRSVRLPTSYTLLRQYCGGSSEVDMLGLHWQ